MTKLTKAEREELRRLHDASTQDPWFVFTLDGYPKVVSAMVEHAGEMLRCEIPADDADDELIVAARNALPRLLADLDAAEAERDEIKAALGVMGATRERVLEVASSQDALEGQIESMRRERDVALKNWSAAETACDAASAQRDRAESELDAERKMRLEAEAASDRSESELATAQSIAAQSTARMEEMRAELASLRADRDAALVHLPVCCGSLADAADTLRQERDELVAERDALKAKLAALVKAATRVRIAEDVYEGSEDQSTDYQEVHRATTDLWAMLDAAIAAARGGAS